MTSALPRIGFIGVGLMGHGMAKNLLRKGFPLSFWVHRNRSNIADLVDLGAKEAASKAELAVASDVIILCVTGSPQVEAAVFAEDGLTRHCKPGTVIIDTTTAEPASTDRIRSELARSGIDFVDAPLSRTPVQAEEGKLNTMVGATPEMFERLKPVFSAYCENVFHAGEPGSGHKIKLVNNALSLGLSALLSEALAGAAKVGVDLNVLRKLIEAGPINNGIFQMVVAKSLDGALDGMKFTIANGAKDCSYFTHMLESAGVPGFVSEAVHQSYRQAIALGLGDRYIASMLEMQEKINGVSIVKR
jgi:3-hydroxyisobutyrate dehydrogenase-like beta-hydroxyacid dehydrogenase